MVPKILLCFLLSVLVACASRPSLYPNQKFKDAGKEVAKKDVDKCIADADAYLKSSKGKNAAKGAGFGAAIGGAMGAVSGMFSGDLAGGMARGAAVGAAGGGTAGAISPDELKRRFVNQCLADQGYQVIGWD